MPELPEVETIRRGLAPFLIGARIQNLILRRQNLRFDFAEGFEQKITGTSIVNVTRRAKYLLFELSSGETLLSHLGMTGNFRFFAPERPSQFEKHDHVVFELSGTKAPSSFLVYSDPRRFGFMDLFTDVHKCAFLAHLGPEPLSNQMTHEVLQKSLSKRRGPIKNVLLDQKVIAGLGNIYVCEALFRAGIHPSTPALTLATSETGLSDQKLELLTRSIRDVLREALEAGGSTLQDYRDVQGETGYFQHRFAVYGRAGEPCMRDGCSGNIKRIVHSGRSSFYCPDCQPE